MIFRFRLKTVLVLLVILALPLAWLSNNLTHWNQERELLENVKVSHTNLVISHSGSKPILCGTGIKVRFCKSPARLFDRLGAVIWPDVFERVTYVSLNGYGFDDQTLNQIAQFPFLKNVECRKKMFSEVAWTKFLTNRPDVHVDYRLADEIDDLLDSSANEDDDPFFSNSSPFPGDDDPFGNSNR